MKGEPITIYAISNISISVTLNVYWNWKTFLDNELIYSNIKTANASWILPTTNARAGYYKIEAITINQTITIWRTLIHARNYVPETLPYSYLWKNVNYTLQGRTLTASNNGETLTLTYPRIPVNYGANFYRNNMTFLIRLTGSGWAVDLTYIAAYVGLKWVINGTFSDLGTFAFQCENNPLSIWNNRLDQWKSKNYLTFDWNDIRKAAQNFDWNSTTKTLTVTIPASFMIDPYIFTDGFESGDISAWTGNTGAAPTIQSTTVHHGTYAMMCDANTEGVYKTLTGATEHYGRIYYQFHSNPSSGTSMYVYQLGAGSTHQMRVYVANVAGVIKWQVSSRTGASTYETADIDDTIHIDQWYCLEIWWKANTNAGAKFWVNNTLMWTMTGKTLNNQNTDFRLYTAYMTAATYYDCAVVDSAKIGPEVSGQNLYFNLTAVPVVTATLRNWKALFKGLSQAPGSIADLAFGRAFIRSFSNTPTTPSGYTALRALMYPFETVPTYVMDSSFGLGKIAEVTATITPAIISSLTSNKALAFTLSQTPKFIVDLTFAIESGVTFILSIAPGFTTDIRIGKELFRAFSGAPAFITDLTKEIELSFVEFILPETIHFIADLNSSLQAAASLEMTFALAALAFILAITALSMIFLKKKD